MVYNSLKEVVPFHKSGHIYIYTVVPRTSTHLYVSTHHHIFVPCVER